MVSKVTKATIAAVAIAVVMPAYAQTTGGGEGLEGFRLPSSSPDIQGPTTPDNPIVQPRAQPATKAPPRLDVPAPKPATPAPTATAKPAPPRAAPTSPSAPATAQPKPATAPRNASTPATAPTPAVSSEPATLPPVETTGAPAAQPAAAPAPSPTVSEAPPPVQSAAAAEPVAETTGSGTAWWRYALMALLLIPMGIGGFLFWRHNQGNRRTLAVEEIERPKPRPIPAPASTATPEPSPPARIRAPSPAPKPVAAAPLPQSEDAVPASAPLGPLRYALETTSLSVSLVNATLSYQLTLTNTSQQMLRTLTIHGDLISAHASISPEEQFAGPVGTQPPQHRIQALLPGQSTFLNGQLRLPISAIRPLRRDSAVLFVPLARLRIEAEGLESVLIETCVVGQKPAGPGAGLRPFRLDTGPRVYAEIGQHTLDQPASQAA